MHAPQDILDILAREYEESLTIPERTEGVQWVLMPVGLIGAGKTTVVSVLAKRLGLIRLSTDDVRERLKEKGYSYEGCYEIICSLGYKYLKLGYNIAFDANTGSKNGSLYREKYAEDFPNVQQIFIHINPPETFIIEKLQNYEHSWLFTDAEEAIRSYHENKEHFTLPDLPFVYEFDTSRSDLDKQIEESIVAIQNALV